MRFAVLYSNKDEAGVNIAEQLKNFHLSNTLVIELEKESIYNENIDTRDERLKDVDFIIFATKHQSKAGTPSLSVHPPGNWRDADFGGQPGKICKTSSQMLKFLFQKLDENAKEMMPELEHGITLECTHHGPLIEEKLCCFIEIGSCSEQWKNPELGKIIAKTISDFQKFEENKSLKSAIAIGGPHYCPNFNKIQLNNKEIAISHIIPEYAFPVTENMLKEAINKTKEQIDLVIIDWKGCGKSESRSKVIEIVEKLGLKYERTERIEK